VSGSARGNWATAADLRGVPRAHEPDSPMWPATWQKTNTLTQTDRFQAVMLSEKSL